jgi:phosphate-selective porin
VGDKLAAALIIKQSIGETFMFLKTALLCLFLLFPLASQASTPKGTSAPSPASKTYDAKGKLIQKTTASGRHYNAKGTYIGKTTSQSRHYDAKGRYTGKTVKVSNGSRIYDAKGKQVGRVKNKPE